MTQADSKKGVHSTLVLLVVSAAILLDALDLSITQVALPDIQSSLHIAQSLVQWVAGAYALTYGGFLLFGGRLVDVRGPRVIFLMGLLVFGVMSLVCGLAQSAGILITSRGLQGVGAALTVPASMAVIAAVFAEGPERNRALGVFAAAASAGFSVGLVLGGVFTNVWGWQWIFFIKVPLVLVILALAYNVLPKGPAPAGNGGSLDIAGAVLGTGGIMALVFAITGLAEKGASLVVSMGAAVVAVGLLGGFWWRERRARSPLLPLAIFRNRILRTSALVSLTVVASPFAYSFIVTLYTQKVLGYSPLQTGLALLPAAVLSALVSRYGAPPLIQRLGLRVAGVVGLVAVSVGFWLMLMAGTESTYLTTLLPSSVVCLGIGMGIAYPTFAIGGVAQASDDQKGVAAGIQQTALQIGGGLGLALVSSAIATSLGGDAGGVAYVRALHLGVMVGAVIPLVGAIGSWAGLPRHQQEA